MSRRSVFQRSFSKNLSPDRNNGDTTSNIGNGFKNNVNTEAGAPTTHQNSIQSKENGNTRPTKLLTGLTGDRKRSLIKDNPYRYGKLQKLKEALKSQA